MDEQTRNAGALDSTDGLGRVPERADFEAWATCAGFGERDDKGRFWFYRNGGDGMWEAYCAGAGDQRERMQDPELSAALGYPGGFNDPVLNRVELLRMVAEMRLAQLAAP